MNPEGSFSGNLQVAGSERLQSKTSKDLKEIFARTQQNGSSEKIGKAQGKHPCWSPVSETLPCNFIKMGLHD